MSENRSIKTKDSVLSIKAFDHRTNLKHYIKQVSIRSRQAPEKNDQNKEHDSEVYSATETVRNAWRTVAVSSVRQVSKSQRLLRRSSSKTAPVEKGGERSFRSIQKDVSSSDKTYQKGMLKSVANEYARTSLQNRPHPLSSGFIKDVFTFGENTVKKVVGHLSGPLCSAGGFITAVMLTTFFSVFSVFTNTTVVAEGIEIPEVSAQPDFTNEEAWGFKNPYTRAGYTGQCTWFAWGRFYEIYGYDPGFRGDGWKCAAQLGAAHPEKFELSNVPSAGAIFSAIGRNHVGIVISVDENEITIQEGNLDGRSNLFVEAITDWREITYPIWKFIAVNGGVVYAETKGT